MATVGVVGLGNMGSVLAGNLVAAGHDVVTHDVAGDAGNPDGAVFVATSTRSARRAEIIVLSLPDGAASELVARTIAVRGRRRTTHIVDTSTIGVAAARVNDQLLAAAGIGYVDAPVSGGVCRRPGADAVGDVRRVGRRRATRSNRCWPV